jgi:hypothetical protein
MTYGQEIMDTNAIPKMRAYLILKAIRTEVKMPPHMIAAHIWQYDQQLLRFRLGAAYFGV